jgi:hypothetical protein
VAVLDRPGVVGRRPAGQGDDARAGTLAARQFPMTADGGRGAARATARAHTVPREEEPMSHHPNEPERRVERETVVTDGGGGGAGVAIAVIVAIIAIVVLLFVFLGGNGNDTTIDVPDEVDVDVTDETNGDAGGDAGGDDAGGDEGGDTDGGDTDGADEGGDEEG